MIFTACDLAGAYVVDVERQADERGFFARTHCAREFAAIGFTAGFSQCSISYNARRGTLRGMHYQAEPHAEDKLVRCTAGAIFDAIIDIRPDSATYRRWFGMELTAANRRALFVPRGFAHGFISLTDDAEVLYMISTEHVPAAARGLRWDDAAVGIEWPLRPVVMSARDAAYPPLDRPAGA